MGAREDNRREESRAERQRFQLTYSYGENITWRVEMS